MLKHTPKYWVSQVTSLPTRLDGSKKRWLHKQNQFNLGKQNMFLLQEMGSCLPVLLYPGLFEIIAQSAYGLAIPSFWMYVGVVENWLLCDFLHFGILFSTDKGTK